MTIKPVLNEVLSVSFDDGTATEAPVVSIDGDVVTVGHANEYSFNAVEHYLADGVWFKIDESTGETFTFAQIAVDTTS